VLSRALRVAVQREKVGRNVSTLVDAPSLHRAEIEPLTADEARRTLQAAVGRRNAARWAVGLSFGLRQDETLGLSRARGSGRRPGRPGAMAVIVFENDAT